MFETSRRDRSGWSDDCDVLDVGVENMFLFNDEVNDCEANPRDRPCQFFFVIEWMDDIAFNIISLKWFDSIRRCDLLEVNLVRRWDGPIVYVVF